MWLQAIPESVSEGGWDSAECFNPLGFVSGHFFLHRWMSQIRACPAHSPPPAIPQCMSLPLQTAEYLPAPFPSPLNPTVHTTHTKYLL